MPSFRLICEKINHYSSENQLDECKSSWSLAWWCVSIMLRSLVITGSQAQMADPLTCTLSSSSILCCFSWITHPVRFTLIHPKNQRLLQLKCRSNPLIFVSFPKKNKEKRVLHSIVWVRLVIRGVGAHKKVKRRGPVGGRVHTHAHARAPARARTRRPNQHKLGDQVKSQMVGQWAEGERPSPTSWGPCRALQGGLATRPKAEWASQPSWPSKALQHLLR